MATTSYIQPTLMDLVKVIGPDGNMIAVAEILTKTNDWLMDAVWDQANDTFSHKGVQRTYLPQGSARQLNAGVAYSNAQELPITDTMQIHEAWSRCDRALADVAPDKSQFRMNKARATIEGMGQYAATAFIYANSGTDPEKMLGLAPRMAALAATANVIGQGGTGSDLTSIYIVQWGLDKVHMIYPRGGTPSINHEDKGIQIMNDGSSNPLDWYVDKFSWIYGLHVLNPKSIARLANIESTGSSNTFDEDNLIKLLNRMPQTGRGAVMYVNPTIKSQMEIKLKDKANVNFTADNGEGLGGVPMMRFRGCPIRVVEAITITEAAVA